MYVCTSSTSIKTLVRRNFKLKNHNLLLRGANGECLDGIDETVSDHKLAFVCAAGDCNPLTAVVASLWLYR